MTNRQSPTSLIFVASVFTLLAATLAASPARAQSAFAANPAAGSAFGAPGQIAITGQFEAHLHNGWELRLHPALDYFIAPNVSVGGLLGITYHSGDPSTTTFDVGARAGYNLHIVDQIGFWPMAGIYYSHFRVNSTATTSAINGSSTFLGIFAPFLFHIVPHLFVGAGPSFNLSLDGGGNSYGLDTVVGGWF